MHIKTKPLRRFSACNSTQCCHFSNNIKKRRKKNSSLKHKFCFSVTIENEITHRYLNQSYAILFGLCFRIFLIEITKKKKNIFEISPFRMLSFCMSNFRNEKKNWFDKLTPFKTITISHVWKSFVLFRIFTSFSKSHNWMLRMFSWNKIWRVFFGWHHLSTGERNSSLLCFWLILCVRAQWVLHTHNIWLHFLNYSTLG